MSSVEYEPKPFQSSMLFAIALKFIISQCPMVGRNASEVGGIGGRARTLIAALLRIRAQWARTAGWKILCDARIEQPSARKG